MRKQIRRPWKLSYRKLPKSLQSRLDELEGKPVRIACARTVPRDQIKRGYLRSVGVKFSGDSLVVPSEPIIPPSSSGTWARRNREGWEIIRRDLPMVEKSFSFETPNWGDWYYGSHTVDWSREVYRARHRLAANRWDTRCTRGHRARGGKRSLPIRA